MLGLEKIYIIIAARFAVILSISTVKLVDSSLYIARYIARRWFVYGMQII